MALVLRKLFLEAQLPIQQAKRFRGKINIQKPKPSHYERQRFYALAKPWFISKYKGKTTVDLCRGFDEKIWGRNEEENPLQRIIANELRDQFYKSRLIAFLHANTLSSDDFFNARVLYHRQNMKLEKIGRKTLEMAVEGTPFEAVLELFISRNMIVFSPEPEVQKLMRVTKRVPQLILLAGIYDGKFINKDELTHYSTIPNLQTAQAGLVQTLNSVGAQLVSHLNSHQTTLVSHLQERAKQLEEQK